MKRICLNLFLGVLVLVLTVAAGSPEIRKTLLNKTAFGHYQWQPLVIEAVNAPASLSFGQRGTITRIFDDWNRVKLVFEKETVEAPTEFYVTRPEEYVYRVYADDDSGRMPIFLKPVEMRIMLPFPENLFDYGLYHLSADGVNWNKIMNVDFYAYTSEVVFDIYEPGAYRLMSPYQDEKQDILPYADGTLLRGPDFKIYAVYDEMLYHIRSLYELSLRFPGKPIINVPMSVIEDYR